MSTINTRINASSWATAASSSAASVTTGQAVTPAAVSPAAAGSSTPTTISTADSARAALDAQATAAKSAGLQVVYDTSQPGRLVDMTKMSPRELAAIANDKDHQFSKDESVWAQGELGGRVATALRPFENAPPDDLRGYQRGVKELYARMDPEVRQALGWTPDMLAMTNKLIDYSDKLYGPLRDEDFWRRFAQGQSLPGALTFDRIDTTA